MQDYDHPAMFPEELPRRLMKLFSYKNDIVLDPFNGAGTSSLVAWKLGRRFIGIDVSRQYCDTALARIAMAGPGERRFPRSIPHRNSWFPKNPDTVGAFRLMIIRPGPGSGPAGHLWYQERIPV